MVLQQNTEVPVWGVAAPGSEVSLQTGWGLKTYHSVAGDDRVYHRAEARVRRGLLWVRASEVANPVSVRYAYRSWVSGDLFNSDGLPASTFKADY